MGGEADMVVILFVIAMQHRPFSVIATVSHATQEARRRDKRDEANVVGMKFSKEMGSAASLQRLTKDGEEVSYYALSINSPFSVTDSNISSSELSCFVSSSVISKSLITVGSTI